MGHRRLTLHPQPSTNGLRQRSIKNRNRNDTIISPNNTNDMNLNGKTIAPTDAKLNPLPNESIISVSFKQNERKLASEEAHIYENIANDITPIFTVKQTLPMTTIYNRSTDLERDAHILEEMNRTANQTLKVTRISYFNI